MAVPTFTMRQLLENGVHFGHQSKRWNPKMENYLFGIRNNIHIIDLQQTVPMFYSALNFTREVAANGGRLLFVGTKSQTQKPIEEAAQRCGQYYVNHRWLGGMLTNWNTISKSIKRLKDLDAQLEENSSGLTKREKLGLERSRDKLNLSLGGIREMGGKPDALIIIDTNKEHNAVAEASKLSIPIVAIVDSNCNPDLITYPIPGNDDATRAIEIYCDLFSKSILDGLQANFAKSGGDVGASKEGMTEELEKEFNNNNVKQSIDSTDTKTEASVIGNDSSDGKDQVLFYSSSSDNDLEGSVKSSTIHESKDNIKNVANNTDKNAKSDNVSDKNNASVKKDDESKDNIKNVANNTDENNKTNNLSDKNNASVKKDDSINKIKEKDKVVANKENQE